MLRISSIIWFQRKNEMKVTKIIKVIDYIFLKTIIGWILLCALIFFITTHFKYEINIRLIIVGIIFTFGSMLYCWKQALEVSKSPDLDLCIFFKGKFREELSLERDKNYSFEILAKNKGNRIAEKFVVILTFEKIEGLKYPKNEHFFEYEKRNGKMFVNLEYNPKNLYYVFPDFSHSLGVFNFRYVEKRTLHYIIEYKILADNMSIKKGKLKIDII